MYVTTVPEVVPVTKSTVDPLPVSVISKSNVAPLKVQAVSSFIYAGDDIEIVCPVLSKPIELKDEDISPPSYNACKRGSSKVIVSGVPALVAEYVNIPAAGSVLVIISVDGSCAASNVIDHAFPASYPDKPKTLLTYN